MRDWIHNFQGEELHKRQPPQTAHCHMRRSVISIGRPGGLMAEITWKAGKISMYNNITFGTFC